MEDLLIDCCLLRQKRGGRGRLLLHIFNIIKKSADGRNLKERGRRGGRTIYGQVREKWLANLSFMYNLLNKLHTHK